jgi:hypothetical protein
VKKGHEKTAEKQGDGTVEGRKLKEKEVNLLLEDVG